METRFSQRLSKLMKERKISGQKLGEIVGKSQKTISRYATGEIDPPLEMKNKIYRVIADISGIEDDALTETELAQREFFWEMSDWIMENPDCGEVRLGHELETQLERNENTLRKTFAMLSRGAKEYYLKHFETFHMVEDWENEVLEFFHGLTQSKKDELVSYLENFSFNYKSLSNVLKIGAYMKMIEDSQKRPHFIVDKEIDSDLAKEGEGYLQVEYVDKLCEIIVGNKGETIPNYPWFLSYTPYDWYFLLRIQIFELQDTEEVLWDAEMNGTVLGRKLAFLLDSMK